VKRDEGSTLVEAAIVLPIILFIALALIFMPLSTFFSKIVLTDAAREAARYVAVYTDQDNPVIARNKAVEMVEDMLSDNGMDTANLRQVRFDDVEGGRYIRVTIEYHQPTMFPGATRLVGDQEMDDFWVVSVSSTFKKEWYVP
jgi:Flp pilus assembly protein TadG